MVIIIIYIYSALYLTMFLTKLIRPLVYKLFMRKAKNRLSDNSLVLILTSLYAILKTSSLIDFIRYASRFLMPSTRSISSFSLKKYGAFSAQYSKSVSLFLKNIDRSD